MGKRRLTDVLAAAVGLSLLAVVLPSSEAAAHGGDHPTALRNARNQFTLVKPQKPAPMTPILAEDGVALIHTIGRIDGPGATNPWIAKYIFPGGHIPALSEMLSDIERAGLYVTDIEVLRLHYAETLKAWRARFEANRERVREIYDERFCRMWTFYLAASELAFRYGGHVVFQIQLAKEQDAVPLTRDYLTPAGLSVRQAARVA